MKVLRDDEVRTVLGVDTIDTSSLPWKGCVGLSMRHSDIMMALGKPTDVTSHVDGVILYRWVVSDERGGLFCVEVEQYTMSPEDLLVLDKYGPDMEDDKCYVVVKVLKSSVKRAYAAGQAFYNLFLSQVKWIKDGTMVQEWSMLGDVQPMIEPIDKEKWLKESLRSQLS